MNDRGCTPAQSWVYNIPPGVHNPATPNRTFTRSVRSVIAGLLVFEMNNKYFSLLSKCGFGVGKGAYTIKMMTGKYRNIMWIVVKILLCCQKSHSV